jgi:hypothetical protein
MTTLAHMIRPVSDSSDVIGIGALRAVITLLVLAHHVALGYHPFAPPPAASLLASPFWQAFPVVDPSRWHGALWFVAFNDTFFMSLMFLISGLFVWSSLARKGPARYLLDRARRLGLPFLAGAALLAPLAYLPSYLQTGAAASWAGFWHQWLALDNWPAGPVWFLWVLLAFNAVVVLLHAGFPRLFESLGRVAGCLARHPFSAFAVIVSASALAYLPLALAYTPLHWTAIGPFAVQTSRVIHYAVYFVAGVAIGAAGLPRGLLAHGGALATRWPVWVASAAAAFWLLLETGARNFASGGARAWQALDALAFVVACGALCFALLAVFVRPAWSRSRIVDSLRANAYAMYVIHYAFVSWLLYALLGAALPGAAKAAIAFVATVALTWATSAALRRLARAFRCGPAGAPLLAGPADQPAA